MTVLNNQDKHDTLLVQKLTQLTNSRIKLIKWGKSKRTTSFIENTPIQ